MLLAPPKRQRSGSRSSSELPAPTGKQYSAKRFKDQVYGHIELPALCIAFIDTPQFQRLRLLKQLGAGYFVFPGASHNRFEHSIGVAWLAGVLMRKIQACQPELEITKQDVELVQLTGLVHDLGHGPFSHLFDHSFLKPQGLTHEDMTLRVLDHLVEDNKLDLHASFGLNHHDCLQFIRKSISNTRDDDDNKKNSFMLDVIHNAKNGLDVDRLDYFERDALNTGMKSNCDVDRLFSELRVIDNEMCFPTKLVEDVLAAYKTRFSLFNSVYSHKVVKAVELMIIDALVCADKSGKVFPWSLANCTVQEYCETNDDVLQQIKRSKSTHELAIKARQIVHRLETRNLYKLVFSVPNNDPSKPWYHTTEKEWIALLSQRAQVKDVDMFRVELLETNFGQGADNPIDHVYFYTKAASNARKRLGREDIACCPATFQHRAVRVFSTTNDEMVQASLQHALVEICK